MMTSIGKLQAAIAAGSQETTLALANLNVDFSIFKVEAPPEFKALASNLSLARIEAAESGSIHYTTRRLGALFREILPTTTKLVSAYGTRVSAISQSLSPHASNTYGPFKSFAGVDATSIWAAATSGPEAIAVHLLACMLARLWPSNEAVSIWRELIVERKSILQGSFGAEPVKLDSLALAQTPVSDDQLAELDASARAWLRAADSADLVSDKQSRVLEFISGVNGLSVNRFVNVYQSVVQAWITALKVMDQVVGGLSFSVSSEYSPTEIHIEDGAVLLALSSWHLYPDIVLLRRSSEINETLIQRDSLIGPSGLITIGLQRPTTDGELQGVKWSLSLAHLRYYGTPILASRSVSSSSIRWSFEQFTIVVLGSLFASWGISTTQLPEAMQLILSLNDSVESHYKETKMSSTWPELHPALWLTLLARAVREYQNATNEAERVCRKLLSAGLRQPYLLNGNHPISSPNFGILNLKVVNLLHGKVDFLADMITEASESPHEWIIKAEDYYVSTTKQHVWCVHKGKDDYRWAFGSSYPRSEYVSPRNLSTVEDRIEWRNPPAFFLSELDLHPEDDKPSQDMANSKRSFRFWSSKKPAPSDSPTTENTKLIFKLYAGTPKVGLYRLWNGRRFDANKKGGLKHSVNLANINRIFERYELSSRDVYVYLEDFGRWKSTGHIANSLQAVAACAPIFSHIPEATISPRLIDSGVHLGSCRWAYSERYAGRDENKGFRTYFRNGEIARSRAFACIAMMETGTLDLDPSQLDQVMAIASEDSIYVAAVLLNDPASPSKPHEIRRVFGNIGRAGLALLIPPKAPNIRKLDAEHWTLLNHDVFDGKLEDCFQTTSLHLDFTGYERPGFTTTHGSRFVDSFFIEARLSVHDRGEWVADLDILKCLAHDDLVPLVRQPRCATPLARTPPDFPLVSIDSWEELLEAPMDPAVVRAHGNWQARLAAATIGVALGHRTVLFGGHGCWSCAKGVLGATELAAPRDDSSGDETEVPAHGEERGKERRRRVIFVV